MFTSLILESWAWLMLIGITLPRGALIHVSDLEKQMKLLGRWIVLTGKQGVCFHCYFSCFLSYGGAKSP